MKNLLILTISIFLVNCSNNNLKTKESIDNEINTFMNKWHNDAKIADFDNYFNAISNDGFFIGTDAKENWTKKEFSDFCKPYFNKKSTWDFKTLERNIYTNKDQNIIWFDELVNSWMGVCRGSGVIEIQNNQYKIKQYIISATVPNENIKEIIKIKKPKDSILISEKYKL